MSGCRADAFARLSSGAILLAVLTVFPAAAQTGAPTPLLGTQPAPGTETPPAPTGATTPAPTQTGIEEAPLGELVNDGIGTLDGAAGLGEALWRGTSRSLAEALIPQIPGAESAAARALARRLLLTSAQPPEGAGGGDLIQIRAERLLALGYPGDAAALRALAPAGGLDAAAAGRLADAWLLAGEPGRACALLSQSAALAADPQSEPLQSFCALLAGDRDRAWFLYDLMREQGPENPAFAPALAIAEGGTGFALPKDTALSPLLLAMLAAGKAAPPEAWYGSPEPAQFPLLVWLPGGGEARIAAAERAARLALIDPAVLGAAYDALKMTAKEREAAAKASGDTLRRRAALYQSARQAADPAQRAKLIQQALGPARGDPNWPAKARLYAPMLRTLPQHSAPAAAAPAFARALFLAGEAEAARPWVALARANTADPALAASLPGLALLSALSGVSEPSWSPAARRFIEAPAPGPEGQRLAIIARLVASDGGAAPQAAPPSGGFFDPGLGLALRNAAAARRIGETVLFSLIALADRGPGSADPGALSEALSALRQIGLEAEARALAIEAAIANGA
jgi:hypothetical protein